FNTHLTPLSTLFPYTTLFRSTKNSGFGVTPSYGKAIRDNLVIGATLNYGNSVNENYSPGNSSTTKNNSFGAGVFIRPYKNLGNRSEEHTSELQSRENLVCRLL